MQPTSADDASTEIVTCQYFRKTQSWLKVCVSNHDEGKHVMMNSLCARSNFCRKIETGLNYRERTRLQLMVTTAAKVASVA